MKTVKILFITLLLATGPLLVSAGATPTMAFGFLANNSDDENFDYLETIFPNSFANSIKNIFDVNVVKPHSINKRLKEYKIELKKHYDPFELPEIIEKIDSDLFIFGNFTPLPNDQIKIRLHLYANGSNRLFTFTNVGKMETEIFKLVDRITMILLNFMSSEKLYMTSVIPGGSNLAILTNIDGEDLNSFYLPFLNRGFKISSFQGNSLKNLINVDMIETYKNISTDENSYEIITDHRKVKFLSGTWSGKKYDQDLKHMKYIYRKYDYDYKKTKKGILGKISSAYSGRINYLLIVGFNEGRSRAWVRCLNLKTKDLVWMQSNIKGDVQEIADKMIKRMTTKIKDPFKNQGSK